MDAPYIYIYIYIYIYDISRLRVKLHQSISPGPRLTVWMFRNRIRLYSELLAPPNPQAGGSHLVGCPRLLIQYIHSYPPYWRPFLHPQPEDAPCRGDSLVNILETHLPWTGWTLSTCVCQVFQCVCRLSRLFAALDLPPFVFQLPCPVRSLWRNNKCGYRASR